MRRTGLPRASTTAWIFVDGPPRERPISCGPLFYRARSVLMGAYDRGIDQVTLAVPLASEGLEEAREHAARRPPRESRVDGLPGAIGARQIAPRRTGTKDPQHALHHGSVGFTWPSALL